MLRLLSYGFMAVLGVLVGILAAAESLRAFSFITSSWILYGSTLIAFIIGMDLLLSREGIRSLFHYGTFTAQNLAAFVLSALGSLIAWLWVGLAFSWGLTALRAVVSPFGWSVPLAARQSPYAFIPLYSFALIFLILVVFELLAARTPFWERARQWLTDDWRGRLAPVLLALILDALAFSVILREWEFLILVALCLVAIAVLPLANRLFSRSRIWAIARLTLAEAMHYRIVVVWVVAILLMIIVLPKAVAGDGLTLKSRVQGYLNFSLLLVGSGLSLLTVGLAAHTLPNEIARKQIFMTTSKPIPRWQIFAGKWVGIGVLNAGMLLMSGAAIWGFTEYMRKLPTEVTDDREALTSEVLSVRHGVPLEEPPDLKAQADQYASQLREADKISADQEPEKARSILEEMRQTWRQLAPGQSKTYVFRKLLVERDRDDQYVQIRIKPNTTSGVDDVVFPIIYAGGDPEDPETLTQWSGVMNIPAERFSTLVLPVRAVNKEGTLYLHMTNLSRRDTMTYEGTTTFELLYGKGTFHWNLVRAMSIIWCRLAFVAALGLLFSSFLSFPVAFLASMLTFVICVMSGFTSEALDSASARVGNKDPIWGPLNLGYVLNPIGKAVVWLLPDFSKYDAVENVVDGRLVPLMWVIMSFTTLVLMWCAILGIIGCVLLTSRELAREGT